MKNKIILGLLLILFSSFINAEIFEGNTVYINDSNAYLSATPHTLNNDGIVYIDILSKQYTGNVNIIFGFNTSNAIPKGLNLIQENEIFNSENNSYHTEIERINIAGIFNSIEFDFDNKNLWYYTSSVPIVAGTTYKLELDLDIIEGDGKYDIGIYPSSYGSDLQSAINNNHLYYLDPYWKTPVPDVKNFEDNFNRADGAMGTASDGINTWTKEGGSADGCDVVSNEGVFKDTSSGNDQGCFSDITDLASGQIYTFSYTIRDGMDNSGFGLANIDTTGGSFGANIVVGTRYLPSNFGIWCLDGGVTTSLGSYSSSITYNISHKIDLINNNVESYSNGEFISNCDISGETIKSIYFDSGITTTGSVIVDDIILANYSDYYWQTGLNEYVEVALTFDDNILSDYSPNKHDVNNNGATYTVSGLYNGAFDFDGINDYMDLSHTEFNTDKLYIEYLYQSTDIGQGAILASDGDTQLNILHNSGGTGKIRIYIKDSTVALVKKHSPVIANLNDGNPHLVQIFFDMTSTTGSKLFFDGIEQTLTNDGSQATGFLGILDYSYYIGAYHGASVSNYFDGIIDELKIIYDEPTLAEYEFQYNDGTPDVTTQYPMNNSNNLIARLLYSYEPENASNLTSALLDQHNNNDWVVTAGTIEQDSNGLTFGVNDKMQTTYRPYTSDTSQTISLEIYPTNIGSTQVLLSSMSETYSKEDFQILITSTGKIQYAKRTGTSGDVDFLDSTTTLTNNNWYNITVIYNNKYGLSGDNYNDYSMNLYVNNILEDFSITDGNSGCAGCGTDRNIKVGSLGALTYSYYGYMKNIKFWDRSLSSFDLSEYYTNGYNTYDFESISLALDYLNIISLGCNAKNNTGTTKTLTTANLFQIEYMECGWNVSSSRPLNEIYLNYSAGGTNACSTGNLQDEICYNVDNSTYRWIQVINNTQTDTFNQQSGDTGEGITISRNGNSTDFIITYTIDEHYNPNIMKHYDGIFNFSDVEYSETQSLGKNDLIRVYILERVPINADQYKLDFRVNISTSTPNVDLKIFLCNNNYTIGNPALNSNCAIVDSKSPTEIINNNYKVRSIFTKELIDTIGHIHWVVLDSDINNPNEYYSLKTVRMINATTFNWDISKDDGLSWENGSNTYDTEMNINWFYDGLTPTYLETLFFVSSNFTSEQSSINSTWSIDPSQKYSPLIDLLTPLPDSLITPPFNITWLTSDPNNDNLSMRLSIYQNGSEVLLLDNDLTQDNNSYYFDDTLTTGNYSIVLFGYKSNFTSFNQTSEHEIQIICAEDWTCADYSNVCVGGLITRTCTDNNQCGSTLTKPVTQSECIETGQAIKDVGIMTLLIIIWLALILIAVIFKKGSWLMIAAIVGFVIFLSMDDLDIIVRIMLMGMNFSLLFVGKDLVEKNI